jgi:uncharacterized protein
MAKFVALLTFSDDAELLQKTRPDHRAYLQSLLDAGKLWMSGPWVDDTGALLIYEVESLGEAQDLLDADPYRTAGVLTDARIKEWRLVFQREN